jgi:hypothetical protein
MADEFLASLSTDNKTLTLSRKDGAAMPATIADAVASYNAKAGRAAWEALQVAAAAVEIVDKSFADTMRVKALAYFVPPGTDGLSKV